MNRAFISTVALAVIATSPSVDCIATPDVPEMVTVEVFVALPVALTLTGPSVLSNVTLDAPLMVTSWPAITPTVVAAVTSTLLLLEASVTSPVCDSTWSWPTESSDMLPDDDRVADAAALMLTDPAGEDIVMGPSVTETVSP